MTTSEKIKEHRRNELRVPMASSVEFKVLAKFQNNLDDHNGEYDTHYLTIDAIMDAGYTAADLKGNIRAFYQKSYEAACEAIDAYTPGNVDDEPATL